MLCMLKSTFLYCLTHSVAQSSADSRFASEPWHQSSSVFIYETVIDSFQPEKKELCSILASLTAVIGQGHSSVSEHMFWLQKARGSIPGISSWRFLDSRCLEIALLQTRESCRQSEQSMLGGKGQWCDSVKRSDANLRAVLLKLYQIICQKMPW